MLWEFACKKIQFKIYALFLLADGLWRREDQNLLNAICKEMELDESIKQKTIAYCQELGITKGDHSDKVIQEIDQALSGAFLFGFGYNSCLWVETVWTLINLGYADQGYSESKKKVIRHLIEKWEIKPEIISELTDTAETILLLRKHEDWLKTLGRPYDEIKTRLETVEQQVQLMFDNIQATISEADAV